MKHVQFEAGSLYPTVTSIRLFKRHRVNEVVYVLHYNKSIDSGWENLVLFKINF